MWGAVRGEGQRLSSAISGRRPPRAPRSAAPPPPPRCRRAGRSRSPSSPRCLRPGGRPGRAGAGARHLRAGPGGGDSRGASSIVGSAGAAGPGRGCAGAGAGAERAPAPAPAPQRERSGRAPGPARCCLNFVSGPFSPAALTGRGSVRHYNNKTSSPASSWELQACPGFQL